MILLLNVQFQVYSISIKIKSTPLQFPEFFMYKTQILRTQIVAVQILRETAMLQSEAKTCIRRSTILVLYWWNSLKPESKLLMLLQLHNEIK